MLRFLTSYDFNICLRDDLNSNTINNLSKQQKTSFIDKSQLIIDFSSANLLIEAANVFMNLLSLTCI